MSATTERLSSPRGYVSQRTLLLAMTVYTVVAAGLLLAVPELPDAARLPLALPLLLVVPGYTILCALFPATATGSRHDSIPASELFSEPERAVVGIVLSIGIVPMVAVVVDFTIGLAAMPVLVTIVGITLLAAGLALVRTPSEQAARTPADRKRVFWWDLVPDLPSLVAIVLVVILLGASAALVLTGNPVGQSPTEFYVESGGTASDGAYDLGIINHGDTTQRFTVVALSTDGSGDAQVGRELDRVSTTVGPEQTATATVQVPLHELSPGSTVQFLLYEGDAPTTPNESTAYRLLKVTVPGESA